MNKKFSVLRFALGAVVLLRLAPVCVAQNALLPMHPARSADEFVESIGVATHWSYTDTPYGFAYDNTARLLGESGIRHVRDGWHPRLLDLYGRFGIRATLIVGPPKTPAEQIKVWRDEAKVISSIEGPNEVDIFPKSAAYQGQTFPEGPRAFMRDLHTVLQADPQLRDIPTLSPTVVRRGNAQKIAPINDFDFLTMHPYAGGGIPEKTLDGSFSNVQEAARMLGTGAVLKPFAVTESGYHTATGTKVLGGVQPGVSERAVGKYIGRHFAAYFDYGITHTDVYEFINEFSKEETNAEAAFGMVRRDGTPKPSYTTVKNLIALLGESKWDAPSQTWKRPPSFTPRALRYSLEGDTKNVRSLLLQKVGGNYGNEYFLLLWQAVPVYDRDARRDVENAPVKVTLKFDQPREVRTYLPTQDAAFQREMMTAIEGRGVKQAALEVPDEVIVVSIATSNAAQSSAAARPLSVPQNLRAQTGNTSAHLTWSPVKGAEGYFVYRLNRLVGTVTKPEFSEDKLWPTLGHPYEVRAFDGAGNVSPSATVIAQLPNTLPDFVLAGIVSKPAMPRAGEMVTFGVVLKNIGDGSAIEGTTHGVAFFVDGKLVAWHDATTALAPGEAITVYATNGPKNTKQWTATAGTHTLRALADDVNRITEKREDNNDTRGTLEVAP